MMKNTLLLLFCMFSLFSVYAQQDVLLEKYMKQSLKQELVIDSLKKVSKSNIEKFDKKSKEYQNEINSKNDSIKSLKLNLSKVEKFKSEMNKNESLFKQKNDSISLLKKQNIDLNKQKIDDKKLFVQNLREENLKGKNEVKSKLINYYTSEKFDELIVSTSKNSIQRDILIIEDNEVIRILNDLIMFFEAQAILNKKYNIEQLKSVQLQLNKLKQPSEQLARLTENIENYQGFNNDLLECLLKINEIDKKETVGFDIVLKKLKYNKILSELSTYIFDNDFNFVEYPYLSDIILELIKRKKPNPDSDINDLIKKLQ